MGSSRIIIVDTVVNRVVMMVKKGKFKSRSKFREKEVTNDMVVIKMVILLKIVK